MEKKIAIWGSHTGKKEKNQWFFKKILHAKSKRIESNNCGFSGKCLTVSLIFQFCIHFLQLCYYISDITLFNEVILNSSHNVTVKIVLQENNKLLEMAGLYMIGYGTGKIIMKLPPF